MKEVFMVALGGLIAVVTQWIVLSFQARTARQDARRQQRRTMLLEVADAVAQSLKAIIWMDATVRKAALDFPELQRQFPLPNANPESKKAWDDWSHVITNAQGNFAGETSGLYKAEVALSLLGYQEAVKSLRVFAESLSQYYAFVPASPDIAAVVARSQTIISGIHQAKDDLLAKLREINADQEVL